MAADLNAMGNILIESGKPDEAQAKFDEAIETIRVSDLTPETKANNGRFYLFNSARAALAKGDAFSRVMPVLTMPRMTPS